MALGMHPQQIVLGHQRCLDEDHILALQRLQNTFQTRHLFGMTFGRFMAQAVGVGDQGCGHGAPPSLR